MTGSDKKGAAHSAGAAARYLDHPNQSYLKSRSMSSSKSCLQAKILQTACALQTRNLKPKIRADGWMFFDLLLMNYLDRIHGGRRDDQP